MAKKEKKDRKSFLREKILEEICKLQPELNRSFDMRNIVYLPETKGLLRKSVPDFKPEEKKLFKEILLDLKNEKILMHKFDELWARLE